MEGMYFDEHNPHPHHQHHVVYGQEMMENMMSSSLGFSGGPEGDAVQGEQWVEISSTLEPPEKKGGSCGVTSLKFDSNYELLWAGHASGRVTATFFPGDIGSDNPEQKLIAQEYQHKFGWASKYSSFKSFHNSAVLEVLPLQNRILSVSEDSVRIHTRGGLPYCTFKPHPHFKSDSGSVVSCGTVFQPSGGLMRGADETYLLLGTSCTIPDNAAPCPVFDLQNPGIGPLLSFDTGGTSTRCVHTCSSASSFLSLGGADGKIRLLDPSMRSSDVHHTLESHSGAIRSLSSLDNGTVLLSCGYTTKLINPFDPKSPVTYHPDPFIHVFDMRMLRQLSPINLSTPGCPVAVQFFPGDESSGPSFLAAAADGTMQSLKLHVDTFELDMTALPEVIYSSLLGVPSSPESRMSSQSDQISCLAVSSSGNMIATGSSLGTLSINSLSRGHNEVHTKVNQDSSVLHIPPLTPPKPGASRQLQQGQPHYVDDRISTATAYICSKTNKTPLEASCFLSSFSSTPALLQRALKPVPRQKISPELLSLASFQDDYFLGSIKHDDFLKLYESKKQEHPKEEKKNNNVPLFPPNSLLCATAKGVAYAISDPRVSSSSKVSKQQQHLSPVQRIDSPHLSPKFTLSLTEVCPGDTSPILLPSSRKPSSLDSPHKFIPPTAYLKNKSHRGKNRMQAFNYRSFNETPFVGLENSPPHSWSNPVLQFLFALPGLRETALRAQTSTYHHAQNPTSLLGELGFLFDMMLSISASAKSRQDVANVATATNFQRVFQCLPEANATGLFILEDQNYGKAVSSPGVSSSGSGFDNAPASQPQTRSSDILKEAKTVQHNVQTFIRFLLQLINKEIEEECKFNNEDVRGQATGAANKAKNIVEQTFGHELTLSTTFLASNTTTASALGTDACSCVLELAYPHAAIATIPPSFAEVLWHSCSQTHFQRGGWCSASESYEPFRQTRSLNLSSVGDFLVLLCGDTLDSSKHHKKGLWSASSLWRGTNCQGSSWLPLEVECYQFEYDDDSKGDCLYISELQSCGEDCQWLIFDGSESIKSNQPASVKYGTLRNVDSSSRQVYKDCILRLKLFGVVSGILRNLNDGSPCQAHSVLHMRTKVSNSSEIEGEEWTMFNDFTVLPCSAKDATQFKDWRFPCSVLYCKSSVDKSSPPIPGWPSLNDNLCCTLEASVAMSSSPDNKVKVPESVLFLPSLSANGTAPALTVSQLRSKHGSSKIGMEGDAEDCILIAFDAEFVSVSVEQVLLDNRGQRVVQDEGRQVLARVSLLDGGISSTSSIDVNALDLKQCAINDDSTQQSTCDTNPKKASTAILMDDCVLPSETVVDYVTRFSGLVEEDLDPSRTRYALVLPRTAYLKLRYYLDAGCVFVGHGLNKDFETANVFVPPERVRDTVELWRIPHQRKISLRFLASYLLKMEIQDDLHDSIEDSLAALLLYRHYQDAMAKGHEYFQDILTDLYKFGSKTNWTIGLDRLDASSDSIVKMKEPTTQRLNKFDTTQISSADCSGMHDQKSRLVRSGGIMHKGGKESWVGGGGSGSISRGADHTLALQSMPPKDSIVGAGENDLNSRLLQTTGVLPGGRGGSGYDFDPRQHPLQQRHLPQQRQNMYPPPSYSPGQRFLQPRPSMNGPQQPRQHFSPHGNQGTYHYH